MIEEAKIGGITPDVFTFKGKCVDCPPIIFRPTTRLAYWIGILRCPPSVKTMAPTTTPMISSVKMTINGHDRFANRKSYYFTKLQQFQRHTRVSAKNIYVYSFSLRPEEYQPSGTLNFSRIDNSSLHLTMANSIPASTIRVYALTYNVMRIQSGMAGVAFTN